MKNNEELIERIYDHCLGKDDPAESLLDAGKLPSKWSEKYLSLVESATETWKEQEYLPAKVVAAIHYASYYLNIRYEVWKIDSGKINEDTEIELESLRTPSEIFMFCGAREKNA